MYTMIQNKGSIHLKLEHIVVSENTSDEFNIGHCQIKVKVTARLFEEINEEIFFLHLPQYKLSSPTCIY